MSDEATQVEPVLDPALGSDVDATPVSELDELAVEQRAEAEEYALAFLKTVLRLRGVRIDRTQFLTAELHKRGVPRSTIEKAVADNAVSAGVSPSMLDEIGLESIKFETRKSSALSFAAGLPGGLAMLGTIPADLTQYYVHAFRVMQKLAYLYGWQSLLDDVKDVDDETLGKLAALLGVMLGVGAASGAVVGFATAVARPAVQKQIAQVALTKTVWYGPMKQVLRVVGVRLTKQTLASTVAKAVPVAGGIVSGGMTLVALSSQSKRLMRHLRELPPPNVDAEAYLAALGQLPDESSERLSAATSAVTNTVNHFRSVDLDGDGIPDEPRAMTAAKGAASAALGGASAALGGLSRAASRVRKPRGSASEAEDRVDAPEPEVGEENNDDAG